MPLLQRYIVPLWKTTPLPRMISKARRFPLLSSHLLYSLVSSSFSPLFQSFRITRTKEGEFPLSLSSSQLFNLASGKKIPWLKVNIGVISRMFRYTVGGYYFLYFSPSAIHSTVRETTPGVLWGHTRDWSLRYAISKPPGKGSRSREQAINRISRDCRPLLHILANNIANDAIGTEGRGRWKRGKNFSSPLFDRPPTCRFFFLFSFFIRIFRFEDSKRGCKRATRDSEQRYSTSQDRADQPDLEGGYRLPLATHHEGDTFTHLFPLLPSIHISISISSAVWIDHRLQFSRNSRRYHRCALENFLNVFRNPPLEEDR